MAGVRGRSAVASEPSLSDTHHGTDLPVKPDSADPVVPGVGDVDGSEGVYRDASREPERGKPGRAPVARESQVTRPSDRRDDARRDLAYTVILRVSDVEVSIRIPRQFLEGGSGPHAGRRLCRQVFRSGSNVLDRRSIGMGDSGPEVPVLVGPETGVGSVDNRRRSGGARVDRAGTATLAEA